MKLRIITSFISSNLKILSLSITIGLFACAISIFAFSSPGSNQPPNGNPIFWLLSGTSMYYTAGNVGIGTNNPVATFDVGGTGSMKIPVGTTAQRPSSPVAGMMRFNTDTGKMEIYNGTSWPIIANGGTVIDTGGYRVHTFTTSGTFTVTAGGNIEVLVVAGGGGGGGGTSFGAVGGGGGAGGLIYNSSFAATPQTYTVTVGSGGNGGDASGGQAGFNGQNSVFGSLTAIGGGGGANDGNGNGGASQGATGGSGGGSSYWNYNGTLAGGLGTSGQGYAGGAVTSNGTGRSGGGGGGAGGAGGVGTGNGGIATPGPGLAYSISGSTVTYATGGSTTGVAETPGPSGAANTGNGGWGSNSSSGGHNPGGNGGSGIVIIRYPI